jgi:hypothetical protein
MTGAPIATLQALPTAITNEAGEYELAGLAAGRYSLIAAKAGFFSPRFERRSPNESRRPIDVADGQVLDDIGFELTRGGIVSGQVLDLGGAPVTGAFVEVLRQGWARGSPRLIGQVASMDRTDDLGQFRLHGIPPGRYVLVSSVPRPNPSVTIETWSHGMGSISTFYPGTASAAEAQPLQVEAGVEVGGLLVRLVAPSLATISGVLRSEDGEPVAANVSLRQPMPFSPGGSSSVGIRTEADGTFRIPDLPPGTYHLRGNSPGAAAGGAVAHATVVLSGTDVFVPLTFSAGNAARGRVVFESGAPPENLRAAGLGVTMEAPDPEQMVAGLAFVQEDWTFEVVGLSGQRLVRATPPRGWTVKSVRLGNTDITDVPLDFTGSDVEGIEVLLTDRLTEVSGVVSDAQGEVVTDAAVVLFADDPAKWMPGSRYIAAARPDQDGRFHHTGLPAGRYVAVALEYLEPGEETNPATLERLRRAGTSFALEDGETHTLDLSLAQ